MAAQSHHLEAVRGHVPRCGHQVEAFNHGCSASLALFPSCQAGSCGACTGPACTWGGLCMSEQCVFVALSLLDLGIVLFPVQPYLYQRMKQGCPVPGQGSLECPSRGGSVLADTSHASLTQADALTPLGISELSSASPQPSPCPG